MCSGIVLIVDFPIIVDFCVLASDYLVRFTHLVIMVICLLIS